MDEQKLLQMLPLTRTWLDDIVDVYLKRPNGEGEVDAVVTALIKTSRDMGAVGEATVTRTINNFCINAEDTEEKARHPIFERIGPATYRLLTFPNPPDLIEIQNIQFTDYAYLRVWEHFTEQAKKNPKWGTMTKRQRLIAFSRNLAEKKQLQELLKLYSA